jgi:hypothetical protein
VDAQHGLSRRRGTRRDRTSCPRGRGRNRLTREERSPLSLPSALLSLPSALLSLPSALLSLPGLATRNDARRPRSIDRWRFGPSSEREPTRTTVTTVRFPGTAPPVLFPQTHPFSRLRSTTVRCTRDPALPAALSPRARPRRAAQARSTPRSRRPAPAAPQQCGSDAQSLRGGRYIGHRHRNAPRHATDSRGHPPPGRSNMTLARTITLRRFSRRE